MALPAHSGVFETTTNQVLPQDTAQWSSWTSWEGLGAWITAPNNTIVWNTDRIDLGRTTYFNLGITSRAEGVVSYKVYTSNTGAFDGEETETVISNSATDVAAFSGRYVIVSVTVTNTGGIQKLQSIEVIPNTNVFAISRSSVDSSTLSGTSSSRTISLGRTVSHIWSINIQPHPVSYNQDVYVTDYPAANTVMPTVLSRTRSGPQFKLVGLDNVPRDAVIDYEIIVMGEQYMSNGNLITR